jgi:high frequency lysogenization protein
MKSNRDRCIALAGMFQSAKLVHEIAYKGKYDEESAKASIYSLFQVEAESVPAVYGGLEGIVLGLNQLIEQLTGKEKRNSETTGYVITMMHLERKLANQGEMLNLISNGIHIASTRLAHFPMLHQNILGQIADIYSDTISTIHPRIMVHGDPMQLQDRNNVNIIRSLLLAGIRSATLWNQCGGSRIQIILSRKKIISIAIELMEEIKKSRH